MHHIATSCHALHSLHLPLALGAMQPAIATLSTHIPGLRRLRLDVKPGGPPSATDNLTLEWAALEELHVEYDWTKDDLEYAPCLRLHAEGCAALRTLRIMAVDKPANLLALSVPSSVREVRVDHAVVQRLSIAPSCVCPMHPPVCVSNAHSCVSNAPPLMCIECSLLYPTA